MNADIFHCLLLISGFECPVYSIVFFHQGLTALHIFQIFHTIAIHLFPDVADDLYQSLVMGTSIDHFMYLYIRCRKHPKIVFFHCFLEFLHSLFQFFQFFFCDPLARDPYRQFFQPQTDFQHIFQILLGNLSHLCTFSGNHDHQTFLFQHSDSLPYRRTADPQSLRKCDFHQTFSGLQFASENCLTKRIKNHIPQWQIFIHLQVQITRHRLFFLHSC